MKFKKIKSVIVAPPISPDDGWSRGVCVWKHKHILIKCHNYEFIYLYFFSDEQPK